jgi:hypothetical protein
MKLLQAPYIVLLLLGFTLQVWSQDKPPVEKKRHGSWLVMRPSDQDVILTISSIEWGVPDRWSFTSRYIHMFDKERDHKTWLNSLTFTISPGISGGRFGIGYQGVYSPKSMQDMAILNEARVVLLRTWGNPLAVEADKTLIGAEIRTSLSGMLNVGVGCYRPISAAAGSRNFLWGFHVGVGM